MAWPCYPRKVSGPSVCQYFYPVSNLPFQGKGEIFLTSDELEALRLTDLLNLYQEEAAKRGEFPSNPRADSRFSPPKSGRSSDTRENPLH